MSYIIEKELYKPETILAELPLSEKLRKQVEKDRQEVIDIIEGKDKRKLLIIGPCSAWPDSAVIEYSKRIKMISAKIKDKIKIVIRIYTQKPRTTVGWTGPINQPDPFKPSDLNKGIRYCRKMMLSILEMGLPIADEALFTHNEGYFNDLISWLAVGARSAEDQEHRIFASMLEHPVGLKNPTSGDIEIGVNSVLAAQNSHVFALSGKQIKTSGNSHAHLVLRGGKSKNNVSLEDLKKASSLLIEKKIKNPSIIVDASHDNSRDELTGKKDASNQSKIILSVLAVMKKDPELNKIVKGFMLESFIKEGNQDLKNANSIKGLDLNGLSLTDPCLGIEKTLELINELHKKL